MQQSVRKRKEEWEWGSVIDEECPECGGSLSYVMDLYSEPKQQSEGKRRPEGKRYINIAKSDDGRAEDDKWEDEMKNEGVEKTPLGVVPGKSIKNPDSASPCRSQRETGKESGRVQEVKRGRGRGRDDIGVSVR